MSTQYKWDAQQECYVPHDKAMLAVGRKVGRVVLFMVVGAMPNRLFRRIYMSSDTAKRVVWWAQS